MIKICRYIDRPFFIYNGRVYHKKPESIEIFNGKPVYKMIMHDKMEITLHSHHVYETEKDARKHL